MLRVRRAAGGRERDGGRGVLGLRYLEPWRFQYEQGASQPLRPEGIHMPQHPTRHGLAPRHSCYARQLANQKEQLIANFKDRDVRVMLGTIDVCNCNAPGYCPSCAQCACDR